MIDLELINEVTHEVVGHGVTLNEIAIGALLILIIAAVSFQDNEITRITPYGRRIVGQGSAHPNSLWAGIIALAVGIPLAVTVGKTGFSIFIVSLAALMMLIASVYTLKTKRSKGVLVATGLALVSVVALVVVLNTLAGNEIVKTSPTTQASAELTRAENEIDKAIVEGYDVEVVEDNSCWNTSGFSSTSSAGEEHIHERRIKFVESALSGNLDDAAGVRLLTGDGVIGCYSVLYDNGTGEARLIVDAKDAELPPPSKLREE